MIDLESVGVGREFAAGLADLFVVPATIGECEQTLGNAGAAAARRG
jgi:hypothetical protein